MISMVGSMCGAGARARREGSEGGAGALAGWYCVTVIGDC